MPTRSRTVGRYLGYSCTALVLGGITFGLSAPDARSADADYNPVLRVEEDWRLVLNEPSNGVESPQFHTMMSPFADLDSYYGMVTWNYRFVPGFYAGGMQLTAWDGEEKLNGRVLRTAPLSTSAETITWSQSLQTDGTTLSFEIFDGQSSTWGTFDRDMRIDSYAYLPNLSGYSPDTSVENSCITFGSNRVDSFAITEVRYYGWDGRLLAVDSTPRGVCEFEEGGD